MPDSPEEPLAQQAAIRVLVANLSGLRLQLMTELVAAQPDMHLIGQVQGQVEVLMAVAIGVDVLILGAPTVQPLPGLCTHLLTEWPTLKILLVATDEEQAMLYWLGLRRHRLRTLSQRALLTHIRSAHTLNPTV